MGNQYTRGRYYHLYINGQYFGLYQTDERPEANFASTYYGGDPEDYDVVHNDPRNNGATNGNLDAYERLWKFFVQDRGLSDANISDYYRAQGMNPDGSRNPAYERLLDVDNLIDYMIITYYTSDADGPGSKFTRPGLNNYFTIFNRANPDGFKFFEHDSEHSLDTGNAAGANYNMVTPLVNNGNRFPTFNPHWMHEQLARTNSDYLIRFQDRVAELFADDGILGDTNVIRMLQERAAQIDSAIIAESARWGDAGRSRPFTKRDWERAVQGTVRWVTTRGRGAGRRAEVLGQLASVDWWSLDTHAPQLSSPGGRVDAGFQLQLTREGTGDIYVMTDGRDPRMSGGAIHPDAVKLDSGGSITIQEGGVVKARTLNNGTWSPLSSARFLVEPLADGSTLHVSEVHFNPADPTPEEIAAGFDNNDDFEFIELINVSDVAVDLSAVRLMQVDVAGRQEGVTFDFADGSIGKLQPGERVLVVEDIAAFQFRYGPGLPVAGQWVGRLSNTAETITLAAEGQGPTHQFRYSDAWHPLADGGGSSLERIDPFSSDLNQWSVADAWRPSPQPGGTPGTGSVVPGDANGDGRFDNDDLLVVFQAGKYEDAVIGNATLAEGDFNGDGDFDSADLLFAFKHGQFTNQRLAPAALAAAIDQIFGSAR